MGVLNGGLGSVWRWLGCVLSSINGSGWTEKWTSVSSCQVVRVLLQDLAQLLVVVRHALPPGAYNCPLFGST